MPRYELADPSEKFWEYVVLEARLFTCYGASDAKGKVAIKDFDCPAKARKDANKRKKEKLAQGYKIVTEKRLKARAEKRNPELEAVLFENPDDADGYAVYSDWLQTEGEPRGEIIALHNAVDANPEDKHLQMHLARLMYAARSLMFPPLLTKELDKARKGFAPNEHCHATWANGFIRSARIGGILDNGKASAADIIEELLAHNSGRFLSELRVATLGADKRNPYADVVKALSENASQLRALYLADVPDAELASVKLGDLAALFDALPKLQTLHLGAASLGPSDIRPAALQSLSLSSPAISPDALKAVAKGPWPTLGNLRIDFHHQDVDWSMLAPVFDALPKLRRLTLSRTKDTAVILKALCKSQCFETLSELSLVDGDLEDSALSSGILDRIAPLGSLNLDRHHLSDAMVEDLGTKVAGTVSAIHQRPKGARAAMTEAHVQALTSPDNFKRGRALAKPAKWAALGKEPAEDILWGEFQGSDFYQAFVTFEGDEMDSACTCPSQFYPCKHILGLLLMEAQQHTFPIAPPPIGLVENAENERYSSVFE